MTLWNGWIVVWLFLIPMIGGISYKQRQWLIWGYGDTRLPSLRTRGPKCHTSRAEMSHKQGQNVTQGPKMSHSHVIMHYNYRQIYLVIIPSRLSIIITCPTGAEFTCKHSGNLGHHEGVRCCIIIIGRYIWL